MPALRTSRALTRRPRYRSFALLVALAVALPIGAVAPPAEALSYDPQPATCGWGYCTSGLKHSAVALPHVYRINPSNADGIAASTAASTIAAGFQTWQNVTSQYMRVSYAGTTTTQASFAVEDGQSVVSFLAGAVPDCAGYTWRGCAKRWPDLNEHIAEFDVIINDNYLWSVDQTPGTQDLQTVATHEAGHAIGLNHPSASQGGSCSQVMFTGACPVVQRTLGQGDIDGIRYLYTQHNPIGAMPTANCNQLRGWAYDPDLPYYSIFVNTYVDSSFYLRATNEYREDVNDSQGITGDHGFALTVPLGFSDGYTHTARADGVNIPAGTNPQLTYGSQTIGPCHQNVANGLSVTRDPAGTVWQMHLDKKNVWASASVFDSYSSRWIDGTNYGTRWDRLNRSPEPSLVAMPSGQQIGYREGSLIRNPTTGTVYAVDQLGELPNATSIRRLIPDTATLAACGWSGAWIHDDDSIVGASYADGPPITSAGCTSGQRPDGQLIKLASGTVALIDTSTLGVKRKRGISSATAFNTWGFNWNAAILVTDTEWNLYATGPQVLMAEGSLIKGSTTTQYAVEVSGDTFVRRAIPNSCSLVGYGFESGDLITMTDVQLGQYTPGSPLPSLC